MAETPSPKDIRSFDQFDQKELWRVLTDAQNRLSRGEPEPLISDAEILAQVKRFAEAMYWWSKKGLDRYSGTDLSNPNDEKIAKERIRLYKETAAKGGDGLVSFCKNEAQGYRDTLLPPGDRLAARWEEIAKSVQRAIATEGSSSSNPTTI